MTAIAEKLDERLKAWPAAKAEAVEKLVSEILSLADEDALELMRSRAVEQEVLDLLDEPRTE